MTTKAKPYNKEILEATSHFPKTSSLSWRIRAIAENNPCSCIQCETIHGNPKRTFCSTECSKKYKEEHSFSSDEKEKLLIKKRFKDAEERFQGKEEGFDYIVCQICGFKGQDLSGHIKQHGYNSKQYKEEFNIRSMKCQLLIDRVKGENNPGYQHGGKFSKWSKNFINGYDEEAHKEFNLFQKERMSSEESRKNSVFCREHYDSDEEYLSHQTKNLDFFVNKYGEEEGKKRYEAKTEKWMRTLSEKSEEEMNEINRKKISQANVSKAERELLSTLKDHFPNIESQKVLNDGWKRFVYDIKLGNKKTLIKESLFN